MLAVGIGGSPTSYPQTLIETWDGSAWSVTPSPATPDTAYVLSVSGVGATSCVAVGGYVNGSGVAQTLVETWDGTTWSVTPSPNPSSDNDGLTSVSCLGSTSCVAVGTEVSGSGVDQTLVESDIEAPAITSAPETIFTAGVAGGFTVAASGNPTPSLVECGALPSGVNFTDNGEGTATLSGTPAAGTGGTYPVTITASNGVSPNAVQNFTLTVNQAPAFTAASPPLTVIAGQSYAYTFAARGFPAPATAGSGAPSWLSINASTGAVSGTVPTNISSFSYSVAASNSVGNPATAGPFTVSVIPLVSLSFTGSLTYTNSGPITSGLLRVLPSTGTIISVTGKFIIPGLKGGSAMVSVTIVRIFGFYIGRVTVSDPSAHLNTTALVLSRNLTRTANGEVTGDASGCPAYGPAP